MASPSTKTTAQVHLIYGEDEYQVAAEARRIVDSLCPEADQALGLEIIDGRVDTVAEAVASTRQVLEGVRTVGFFGSGKVVWFRDASFLADCVPARSDDVKDVLRELAAEIERGLGADQHLVISARKVDGRGFFLKACKQVADVKQIGSGKKAWDNKAAMAWAKQQFDKAGLRAGHGVLESFVQRAGSDSRQIVQEVEKLAVYLGDRKDVRPEDIEAIVAGGPESVVWNLCDAVADRDLQRSLRILRELLFQKQSPVGIIILLEMRFRELLVSRVALDKGWVRLAGSRAEWSSSAEVEEALSSLDKDPRSGHPYAVMLKTKQAAGFSERELIRWHAAAVSAHERMVSGGADGGMILEIMLAQLMRRRGGPGQRPGR